MSLDKRLPLFPITASVNYSEHGNHLTVDGASLFDLADEYGTPYYLFDQATMDDAVAQYRTALTAHYPGESSITFAGKSFLCTAVAQWAERRALWLDCTGVTELAIASAANVFSERILVHGVNKSRADLDAALRVAGVIVVDNLAELDRLIMLLAQQPQQRCPHIWLRMRPGFAVETHKYNQTGQENSKFGMSAAEMKTALRKCLDNSLPVSGVHFHQGSHFHRPDPVAPALDSALDLIVALRDEFGWTPTEFCPGGGWGAPYHEDDLPHPTIADYVRFMAGYLAAGCQMRGLTAPRLHVEPGRSLIARAGVAVYRVGAVKRATDRRWLLIDGGIADNPRPALYGARYSALPALEPERGVTGPTWIGGPYCESGDVLIEDLPLPDVQPGELLAVPVSGAYQLAMGSNYNGACKPAILWTHNGSVRLVQRRQTPEDLLARDIPLPPE